MKTNINDLCTSCHKDTSVGSGRFVKRIPTESDDEIGYMCAQCQSIECDNCQELTLEYIMTECGSVFCEECAQ